MTSPELPERPLRGHGKEEPRDSYASADLSELSISSPFLTSQREEEQVSEARAPYLEFSGKQSSVRLIRSAVDPLHGISIDPHCPFECVIEGLLDTPLVQRLRDVRQLAGSWHVYPDAVHYRFGHVLGSAKLTSEVLEDLVVRSGGEIRTSIQEWGPAVVAFAMLHDLGHIAPGSHVAQRVWFPGADDEHEELSKAFVKYDEGLRSRLRRLLGTEGLERLELMMLEKDAPPSVPKWTWQLVAAGGWNTDRGDWVSRDSDFCGALYGKYDRPIIMKNLAISEDGELAIKKGGIESLERFFQARADMYRNVYFHPVARISERICELIGRRARELYSEQGVFADPTVTAFLEADRATSVPLAHVANMVESVWTYHVHAWSGSSDKTLRELCRMLLQRPAFKRFENNPAVRAELTSMVARAGYDPEYFVLEMPRATVDMAGDIDKALGSLSTQGTLQKLSHVSQLFNILNLVQTLERPGFIAVPEMCFGAMPLRH